MAEVIDVADFPFAVTISVTLLRSNVAQVDRAMATAADTIRTVTGLTLCLAFFVISLTIIVTRGRLKWNPKKEECLHFTPLARIPPQPRTMRLRPEGSSAERKCPTSLCSELKIADLTLWSIIHD